MNSRLAKEIAEALVQAAEDKPLVYETKERAIATAAALIDTHLKDVREGLATINEIAADKRIIRKVEALLKIVEVKV